MDKTEQYHQDIHMSINNRLSVLEQHTTMLRNELTTHYKKELDHKQAIDGLIYVTKKQQEFIEDLIYSEKLHGEALRQNIKAIKALNIRIVALEQRQKRDNK